jgi:hypothetical protein
MDLAIHQVAQVNNSASFASAYSSQHPLLDTVATMKHISAHHMFESMFSFVSCMSLLKFKWTI